MCLPYYQWTWVCSVSVKLWCDGRGSLRNHFCFSAMFCWKQVLKQILRRPTWSSGSSISKTQYRRTCTYKPSALCKKPSTSSEITLRFSENTFKNERSGLQWSCSEVQVRKPFQRTEPFLDMYCKCYLHVPDSEVHLLTRLCGYLYVPDSEVHLLTTLCGSARSPVEEEWFKLLEREDFWLEAREGPHGLLVVEVQCSQAVQVQTFRLDERSHDLAGGRIQTVKIGFRLPVFLYTLSQRSSQVVCYYSNGTSSTHLSWVKLWPVECTWGNRELA